MDTTYSTNRKFKSTFANILSIFVILAMAFPVTTVAHAATSSPFLGQWQATDVDGSDIRLTISGRPNGPFQITWTESYISFCNTEAGIVRGTGHLDKSNPNLLEADLHLKCFTTGATLDFHLVWRYHPTTNMLSSSWNGVITIWHRPGSTRPAPPALNLRVNYGDDWVESFYEAGHTAWITVTTDDGLTVKATAELFTEAKDYWGGETGFQSLDGVWFDAEGNLMDSPPDIQPNDWVFGWVDNGASAHVQIGDISGLIDLVADSIGGTIYAPWFSEGVNVECFPWGAPNPQPEMKFDAVQPNGEDTYTCSWADEWDVQPWQQVGVRYFGLDGHWVANAFFVASPRIQAISKWDYIMGHDWPLGATVHLTIDDPSTAYIPVDYQQSGTAVSTPWNPNRTWVEFNFAGSYDMKPGDVVTLTDGSTARQHIVKTLTLTGADSAADIVAGTADTGEIVYVSTHGEWFELRTTADSSGMWQVDFTDVFDVPPGIDGQAEIRDEAGNSTVVDWHTPNPRFTVFPEQEYVEGWDWPDGATMVADISGSPDCSVQGLSMSSGGAWSPTYVSMNFPEGCDVVAGNLATLSDGTTTRMHTVQDLAITDVDKETNTVAGTADVGALVYAWVHGFGGTEMQLTVEDGTWLADFDSVGFDLLEGMCGRSEIRDEVGNSTAVDWCIPNPHFSAFPEWEYIEGWEWPVGANIHLKIDDPATEANPDFEQDQPVVVTPWDLNGVWVSFNFAGQYDMKLGDIVTLTDGTTPRTHTIQNLAITSVDKEANTMAGTADPGAQVHVWPHGYNELLPTTDENGIWLADFNSIDIDLVEGMGGRTEIRDEFSNATAVEWRIPNPRFVIFPEFEWFDGNDWPDGATVNITVEGKPECAVTKVSWGGFFNGSFGEGCDVVVGDTVTFTDGETVRTHTVRNLAITDVNKTADTVSGTADIGEVVYAWVHGFGETEIQLTVEDGTWLADFGSLDFDLVEGTCGRSEIRDEAGNSTAVDWCVPNPHFSVFPEWEYIEGWEWPDGATVYATIEGKPLCSVEGIAGYPEWDPITFVPMWFPEGCDAVVGDVVTLTDGVTSRMHTVQNLAITAVDKDANTIIGTAGPGALVHVWPHGYNELLPTTDENGIWLADFNSIGIDLMEGMAGRTEIRDEVGNATAVEWRIPKPHFSVIPDWKYIEGYEWPNGASVTATIDGKPECSVEGTAGYPEWDRWNTYLSMNFPGGCDVEVGNVVTLTDGATTRTHTVRNLALTAVDKEANTVSGTADAGAQVHVWAHGYNDLLATTAEDGTWLADFDSIGIDLVEGMCGRAEIRDEIGNATAIPDWCIPSPRLIAFPAVEQIFGYNWPEGSEVHLTINTDQFMQTATVGPSSWDPNDIVAFFDFKGQYDLKPGDVVTLSGSDMERIYTVRNLTVTEVNEVTNTVSGTADPGARIMVYPFEFGNQPLRVTADGNGDWFANFAEAGIDLVPGMCGRSDIFDEFTNSTTVDWCIPAALLPARILVQITDNWFEGQNFTPNAEQSYEIYDTQGGTLLLSGTMQADNQGTAFAWVGNQVDLVPGNYVVISDGITIKDLILEALTFNEFDLSQGLLRGTAPPPNGRQVWVGIGWESDAWTKEVTTDPYYGYWIADFDKPVPNDYAWVAAQVFDPDGDVSEVRPERVVDLWVAVFTYDLPAGSWTEGQHAYYFYGERNVVPHEIRRSDEFPLRVLSEAPLYDGFVLLRTVMQQARAEDECINIAAIHPNQTTRFLWVWDMRSPASYDEAVAYFDSIAAWITWDNGTTADFVRHEIISFESVDWAQYVCSFTK